MGDGEGGGLKNNLYINKWGVQTKGGPEKCSPSELATSYH